MPVRIVQSKQNARLKELRRALSSPGRNENRLAGIEGLNLLEEALRAGLRVVCVFIATEAHDPLRGLALPAETEVLMMPRELLDTALVTETPQAVAALVEPPDWTWVHLIGVRISTASLIVVLAGLQDPGNLGTIVRSAEAFGADGILCLPGTVSAWNPKAVRASAGSVFRVPLLAVAENEAIEHLREAGVKIVATTVSGADPANIQILSEPVALLIGNEGNGLPTALIAKADVSVTIPYPGSVESLNAAVAASVLLYEASRQRSAKSCGQKDHRGARR
jgi:RNA methyltransferase, TrmH family